MKKNRLSRKTNVILTLLKSDHIKAIKSIFFEDYWMLDWGTCTLFFCLLTTCLFPVKHSCFQLIIYFGMLYLTFCSKFFADFHILINPVRLHHVFISSCNNLCLLTKFLSHNSFISLDWQGLIELPIVLFIKYMS